MQSTHHKIFKKIVLCAVLLLGSLAHLVFWRFPEVEDPKNSPSSLLVYWTSLGKPRVKTGAPTLRNTQKEFSQPTWGCQQSWTFHQMGTKVVSADQIVPLKVVRTETPGFVPRWNECFLSQSTWPSFHQWIGLMEKSTGNHGFPYEIWGSNRPCSDSQSVALRLTSTRFSSYPPPIQAGCLCSESWRGLERWSW